MFHKLTYLIITIIFVAIVIVRPAKVDLPAANPVDPANEDLSRIDYPSHANYSWKAQFIRPEDSLESLFGNNWPVIARFNRVDRRHVYPGMTIKVPEDIDSIRKYNPLPAIYEPARRYYKYILINLTEQWLGAYEYGKLKFSMPAATGTDDHATPTGIFRVTARHRHHTSSLYQTEDKTAQYPMDNAIRFHIAADNVSYWIHARDLPGRPASHGCVGLFDEAMQNRVYGTPEKPVLLDSQKLYSWAVGNADYEDDTGEFEELEDGPVVEVAGKNPLVRQGGPGYLLARR